MPNIKFYRCSVCGNVMVILLKSHDSKVCCDQQMIPVEPKSTDGTDEKHVPVVSRENGIIHVAVGETLHPMLPEHYIEMVAIDAGKKTEVAYLAPGLEPKVDFADIGSGTVYEYCSVHGLWKADY